MTARPRSWLQKSKQHPVVAIFVFVGSVLGIALIVAVVLGYWLNWHWTGLVPETSEPIQHAKTLWDWLNLLGVLAIPAVVGLGAAWYTAQQGKVSDRENTDNQRATALQKYIDNMSELLLHEDLRGSDPEKEVRKIARVRTLTVLRGLDRWRKGSVLQFLYESGLIYGDKPIIDLSGANFDDTALIGLSANLRQANLQNVLLRKASLWRADLTEANLYRANMFHAILFKTKLANANLKNAYLSQANISEANLSGANLTEADLSQALLFSTDLSGAVLTGADLNGARLLEANLSKVDLSGAKLTGAYLIDVNLSNTIVTSEQLKEAKSLKGATMPDGSIHP